MAISAADFTGQGKNYAQFPDRQGFRTYLEELHEQKVRERLRLIWLDPHKLDPAKIAAKATREVADILSRCKDNPSLFPLFIQEPHRAPAAARGNRRTLGSRQAGLAPSRASHFWHASRTSARPRRAAQAWCSLHAPRSVERLVAATVLEPLKEEWSNVQAAAEEKRGDLHLKGGSRMPGVKTNDLEPELAEFMHEPWRHRSGFDSYADVISRMPQHHFADLFWKRGALAPP